MRHAGFILLLSTACDGGLAPDPNDDRDCLVEQLEIERGSSQELVTLLEDDGIGRVDVSIWTADDAALRASPVVARGYDELSSDGDAFTTVDVVYDDQPADLASDSDGTWEVTGSALFQAPVGRPVRKAVLAIHVPTAANVVDVSVACVAATVGP